MKFKETDNGYNILMCAGGDSNPHVLADTCPSSMLVYRFPHLRVVIFDSFTIARACSIFNRPELQKRSLEATAFV